MPQKQFNIDLAKASSQDRDILQELIEEQLVGADDFHALVDDILDEVEARFEFIAEGTLETNRDNWPRLWTYETDDRGGFHQVRQPLHEQLRTEFRAFANSTGRRCQGCRAI